MATVTIAAEALDTPGVDRLLQALDDYLNSLYRPAENFLDLPAGDVAAGRGAFLVARLDGVVVGCGAVRQLDDTTAEVKRMFVDPPARGRGVGRRLLEELEAWAVAAGMTRLVLEAGDRQQEAIRLYQLCGFRQIPCFGQYAEAPLSSCFEKVVGPWGSRLDRRVERHR